MMQRTFHNYIHNSLAIARSYYRYMIKITADTSLLFPLCFTPGFGSLIRDDC
ncbi:MAG: hypothetical protein JETT_2744 [Candidatus Jettenia ecosi]|uniref:Uncharacterized protein n=1 Tax=Candidatus Jettenia ecosi TaxID=2494326 RepID=A0A533Q9P4_9BACT|nr:MAG: hypothetical protein JETT_2744 [Candidatus Jettenia ecosi]